MAAGSPSPPRTHFVRVLRQPVHLLGVPGHGAAGVSSLLPSAAAAWAPVLDLSKTCGTSRAARAGRALTRQDWLGGRGGPGLAGPSAPLRSARLRSARPGGALGPPLPEPPPPSSSAIPHPHPPPRFPRFPRPAGQAQPGPARVGALSGGCAAGSAPPSQR